MVSRQTTQQSVRGATMTAKKKQSKKLDVDVVELKGLKAQLRALSECYWQLETMDNAVLPLGIYRALEALTYHVKWEPTLDAAIKGCE